MIPVQRRLRPIQDSENVEVGMGKKYVEGGPKRRPLATKVLNEINTNVRPTKIETESKIAAAAVEFETKAIISRPAKNNYKNVTSKINTGLSKTNIPAARPPLRREESTASHASFAALQAKGPADQGKENMGIPSFKKTTSEPYLKLNKPVIKKTALQTLNEKPIVKQDCLVAEKSKTISAAEKSKTICAAQKSKTICVAEKDKTKNDVKPVDETSGKLFDNNKEVKGTVNLQNINTATVIASDEVYEIPLPAHIEDIDAKDEKSDLMCTDYIKDIYNYLRYLEDKYEIAPDFMDRQKHLTGQMRTTLVDWLLLVSQQFSLLLETFQLAIGILDRYLTLVPTVKRSQLQLVGITSLWIASKYEEIYPPEINDFVYASDQSSKKHDILRQERMILTTLGFCLGRPLPVRFLRRFIKASDSNSRTHHLGKFFIDFSLISYKMAYYKPSELAAASLCLSLSLNNSQPIDKVWTPTLTYYSGYKIEYLKPIIYRIATLYIINHDNSKFNTVIQKYSKSNVLKVAMIPMLKIDTLKQLAKQSDIEIASE